MHNRRSTVGPHLQLCGSTCATLYEHVSLSEEVATTLLRGKARLPGRSFVSNAAASLRRHQPLASTRRSFRIGIDYFAPH